MTARCASVKRLHPGGDLRVNHVKHRLTVSHRDVRALESAMKTMLGLCAKRSVALRFGSGGRSLSRM